MQLPLISILSKNKFSAHVFRFALCSHCDQKFFKIVKEFSSFILMSDLVGKHDLLSEYHVFIQILYRAISEVTCKDGCPEPRTFLLFSSC